MLTYHFWCLNTSLSAAISHSIVITTWGATLKLVHKHPVRAMAVYLIFVPASHSLIHVERQHLIVHPSQSLY